jgi:hypothetical protein
LKFPYSLDAIAKTVLSQHDRDGGAAANPKRIVSEMKMVSGGQPIWLGIRRPGGAKKAGYYNQG